MARSKQRQPKKVTAAVPGLGEPAQQRWVHLGRPGRLVRRHRFWFPSCSADVNILRPALPAFEGPEQPDGVEPGLGPSRAPPAGRTGCYYSSAGTPRQPISSPIFDEETLFVVVSSSTEQSPRLGRFAGC